MLKKIIRFPFFTFLIGFFPIIALWNGNKSQVYPRDVWFSIGLTMAFVLLVWFLCLLIFRSADRASLVSSVAFIMFFSFGHVYNLVENVKIFGTTVGFLKLLAAYAVLFFGLLIPAIRTKKISLDIKYLLNGVFTLLILFNIGQIIVFEIKTGQEESLAQTATQSEATTPTSDNTSNLPDIYYIILDSYSRPDVLKDDFEYDDSAFVNALEERGFYVPDCSNSNYDSTLSSLTSSLNYSYLPVDSIQEENVEGNTITTSNTETPSKLSMKHSKIRANLAAYGYKFVTAKGFSSEDDVNNSDIYLDYLKDKGIKDTVARSEFTRMYLETTLFRVPFEYYYMDPVKYSYLIPQWMFISFSDDKVLGYASFWYNQTKYVFDYLEKFPEMDGNYLIYAHMNIPHQPFVFDAEGNFKYTYNPPFDQLTQPYLDQISYANKSVLKLVDVLISKSSTPPIIIIQGDHGAHIMTTGLEKHKILNAYYVPEKMRQELYETITPVNTFRLVLRDVFSQNIDLLPDTLYVKFTDGYESVPSSCPTP